MDPEKSGDSFPSQAEYREAETKSCVVTTGKYHYACSALTLLPRPPLSVYVGDELMSCWGPSSHQARLMFSSDPQTTPQRRQEHLEAGTVIAAELLCRKQLGYIHSTEA